ncbi:MAG: hypothetical protein U5K43_01140 [Halofilum sp. (in: g-proteobacteria)]|nr:hypothetical protein [Halofilum sp. (in: g-proteobacteria)]
MRTSNLLMILVLLPFWTSLLVRTSSWIVLLQQQGVINDTLVCIGIVGDDERLQMIYNQTGTIVGDDPHPAAVHDPAALLGDEDHPALLRARGQVAGRHRLDGVLAGLLPQHRAGHRRRAASSSSSSRSATTSRPR